MGVKMDRRTNRGMMDGWEDGQAYKWGSGDEGWVGRWTDVRMGVEMRDGWEDGQAYRWGWR